MLFESGIMFLTAWFLDFVENYLGDDILFVYLINMYMFWSMIWWGIWKKISLRLWIWITGRWSGLRRRWVYWGRNKGLCMCYEIMVSVSGIGCVLLHRWPIVRAGEVIRGCLSLVRRCRFALVVRAGLVDWTYLVIADMEDNSIDFLDTLYKPVN